MSGTFSRVEAKRARAQKHIHEVKELIERFRNPELHPLVFDTFVHARSQIVAVRFRPQPFHATEIADALGDAIHNLRATLDYLIWELGARNRRYRPRDVPLKDPLRSVGFPIYLDPDEFEPKKKSGAPTRGGGARDMLRYLTRVQYARVKATQPFKQPDHSLWLLSELDNLSKHRHAHIVRGIYSIALDRERATAVGLTQEFIHPGGAIENNTQIARVRVYIGKGPAHNPTELQHQVDICLKRTLVVTFGQGSPAEGEDILRVLARLQGRVTRTINLFRDQFRA